MPSFLRPGLAAVLVTAALAACAPRPPPAPEPPPGPPPGVDGRYRGTARLIRSNNRFCPRSGPRVYEVQNGMVSLAYSSAARPGARPSRELLSVQIQPNGQFSTSDGVGTMSGSLVGDTLELTIASKECEHHWTMRKVP